MAVSKASIFCKSLRLEAFVFICILLSMRSIFLILLVLSTSYSYSQNTYPDRISEEDIQKAEISKRDSMFWIGQNIRKDYRIIGYEKPDVNSRRLVIFSVFTRDVQNNPYQCPFGAYYGSALNDVKIKYKGRVGNFIVAELTKKNETATMYFEKKWVKFSD